jgi:hypothetical protein
MKKIVLVAITVLLLIPAALFANGGQEKNASEEGAPKVYSPSTSGTEA